MSMIDDIIKTIKKQADQIRDLTGRVNAISIGNQITPNIPGQNPVPAPLPGATIAGNATPAWQRVAAPTPTGAQVYEYTYQVGDIVPVWRLRSTGGKYLQFTYEVSGGGFTFIIDGDGNPIFTLLDVE